MYGDLATQAAYWKLVRTDRVEADTIISKRPCFLYSVDLVSDGVGAATAVLRDGETDSADIVLDLSAPTSGRDHRRFNVPLYFKKGLFIDVGSNVTSVIVQYLIAKEAAPA